MREIPYDRNKAIKYASKWAFKRNPHYYNFDSVGGDCTSFVSQCIYSGCKTMNYKKYIGWYYNSADDRAPAWSGVEYLYNFLTSNDSIGPRGKKVKKDNVQKGDVIQLKFSNLSNFSHSLLVVDKSENEIFVATHTDDSYYRKLSTYEYEKIRFIHINKIFVW